jgi:hypothetical protein
MRQRSIRNLLLILTVLIMVSGGIVYGENAEISTSYLYTLSNFTGIYPVSWAKLDVDPAMNEVYVLSPTKIKIFDESGMETYSFNEFGELGMVTDVAVESNGEIIALSYQPQTGQSEIIRCNFRGEPISTIGLKGLPAEYAGFAPNRIVIRGASLYLANTVDLKVVVTDETGAFQKSYDLAAIIDKELEQEKKQDQIEDKDLEKEKEDRGITGFTADAEGNLFFTNGVLARVYRISRDGQMRSFGQRGSTAGKFGVLGDIAIDATGKYLLVADILRCVVLVFDKNFQFHTEFGLYGYKPSNLVGPMYLGVDGRNRIYVSQLRNRGVNVYQMSTS